MTTPTPTTTTTDPQPQPQPQPGTTITIRLPSKYTTSPPTNPPQPFTPPPLPFLHRTWSVTHSTLSMWRSARNVRITYGPLPPKSSSSSAGARVRLSDLVEYEALSGSGGVKRIAGVDTASSCASTSSSLGGDGGKGGEDDGAGEWDWRGSGWLFFVGSHWEVLGWGERAVPGGEGGEGQVERWVVTWFAQTLFTAEGVDVYSDRREGGSEELVREVLAELGRVTNGKGKLGELVEKEMREVKVALPWKEG